MDASNLKYFSLIVLVVQNSALILMMRYTRASVSSDQLYLASTAVLMSEVLKALVCLYVVYTLLSPKTRSVSKLVNFLYKELIVHWRETIKLAFPAILYLIQNNLQYVAATNLDAATFQVTYQFKILTTAFFSVVLLHRSLSRTKWIALGILTFGIAMVVLPKHSSNSSDSINENDDDLIGNQSNAKGLFAVFTACILSGMAGVYFEKIVKTPSKSKEEQEKQKNSIMVDDEEKSSSIEKIVASSPLEKVNQYQQQQVKVQLWVRNIQLSLFSVLLGSIFVLGLQDGKEIVKNGFFYNYNWMTWVVILIQAGGGLIVALVVRYADNILKGFATSISIILSSLISFWLFQFEITFTFIVGCILVVYATYLYGKS